jgi:hypothetical protein
VAQKIEAKEERPLQSFTFKDFLAVNTTNARTACPAQAFYDLENAQPIGAANLHSVNDISGVLHDYAGDTIYYDEDANISNTEYLIQVSTTSKAFAYNVGTQAVTQINGAINLAGSGTRMAQWQNSNVLFVDSTGYYQWPGSGTLVSLGGATGAPTSGSTIAVYQNRVWITQGRLLYFSAPGSFTDFTTASGGGFTALNDSTLRSSVQALLAANGYLYLFGVSSIDSVSDLYVPAGASPPTPNFTKLNLSPIIGTDQPSSIFVYGRLVLFGNRYGAWSLYGTTLTPISSPDPNNQYNSSIDGTWQYVDFSQVISGAQCVSNNLLCGAFMLKRLSDPVFGSNTIIAMYQGNAAGGRWWFANTALTGTPTRITTGFVSNAPALFAYIGNKLYQLFANSASAPPATISTALWDFNDPITQKQVIKAGLGITVFVAGAGIQSFTLDTENTTQTINFASAVGFIQWTNNAAQVVTWQNNALATVQWIPALVYQTYWGQAGSGFAKYVGFTLKTGQGMVFEINAFLMDYKWGPRWTGN